MEMYRLQVLAQHGSTLSTLERDSEGNLQSYYP